MKKKIQTLLALTMVFVLALTFSACNYASTKKAENTDGKNEIYAVYTMYVAYAEENGVTPLAYEEWLASIKGDKGDKGEQGIQGLQGEQGEKGEKGDKGEQGIQGLQGEQGEKGEKGDKGEQGIQGLQGEQGEKGEKGDKGEQGIQGLQGGKGDTGVGVENAHIDENGDLIVTLTSGETVNAGHVVDKENEHIHSYGEWIVFTTDTAINCENKIKYRVCETCKAVEWAEGVDHSFGDWQPHDGSKHKRKCDNCNYYEWEDHIITYENSDKCSVCGLQFNVTPISNLKYYNYANGLSIEGFKSSSATLYVWGKYNLNPESSYKYTDVVCVAGNSFSNNTSLYYVKICIAGFIGQNAFSGCTNLKLLVLANNITSISYNAFADCSSLETIFFLGTIEEWDAIRKAENWCENSPVTKIICSDGEILN